MSNTDNVLNVEIGFTNITIDASRLTLIVDTVVDGDNVECLIGKSIFLFEEEKVGFLGRLVEEAPILYISTAVKGLWMLLVGTKSLPEANEGTRAGRRSIVSRNIVELAHTSWSQTSDTGSVRSCLALHNLLDSL